MNKKVLLIIVLLAIIIFMAQFVVGHPRQDFDGHFTMDVPFNCHYSNVAWCWDGGGLGCRCEYWEDYAGCELSDGEMIVFYYNESLLCDDETSLLRQTINTLNKTYMYQVWPAEGDLMILTNDLDMKNVPPYLVGKESYDGSEIVFVGCRNLDDAKQYANTIEFK